MDSNSSVGPPLANSTPRREDSAQAVRRKGKGIAVLAAHGSKGQRRNLDVSGIDIRNREQAPSLSLLTHRITAPSRVPAVTFELAAGMGNSNS